MLSITCSRPALGAPTCRSTAAASRPRHARVVTCSQREEGFRPGQKGAQPHAAPERQRPGSAQGAGGGHAGVDRREAAAREIRQLEGERAGGAGQPQPRSMTASDDEWEHMPVQKKWWMELKAVLYSWLGTGVEPL